MLAHAVSALLALAALHARAQDATILVDVNPTSDEVTDVEKRYTPELEDELRSARDDALLLYTEFSGQAGLQLKLFLKEMTGFADHAIGSMDDRILYHAPPPCRSQLESTLRAIEHDAKLAATFSGDNHHKFFLGHMVVFSMHLNKSENFIKRCDNVIKRCGVPCETTPRIRRWRRHAANELHRVRDDIQHSRRSYRDLLTHVHRYLKHLRRRSDKRASEATDKFMNCIRKPC